MDRRHPRVGDLSQDPEGNTLASETTAALLGRAKRGDGLAVAALVERYSPRLRRWARGRLPAWARQILDTDDLVQEALLETIQRLDTFEPRHERALEGYLRRTIQNRIRDEVRNARRAPAGAAEPPDPVDPSPSPLEGAVGFEALRRYEGALERLGEEAREAVILRLEIGLSYDEVAEALGKPSADAARMVVNRAMVRLAKEMGHER